MTGQSITRTAGWLLLLLTVASGEIAAQHVTPARFTGQYQVIDRIDSVDAATLTMNIVIQASGDGGLTNATAELREPVPSEIALAQFSFEPGSSLRCAESQATFTVPLGQADAWERGFRPRLVILYVNSEGEQEESRVKLWPTDAPSPCGVWAERAGAPVAGPFGIIDTVIGAFDPSGARAVDVPIESPFGVATDEQGKVYFSDAEHGRVFRVDAAGILTVAAGDGMGFFDGDGIPAVEATLEEPLGIAIDSLGQLFIADYGSNLVLRVDTQGIITTVAGNGHSSGFGSIGDGGPATEADLSPVAVEVDGNGKIYIAEGSQFRVRGVDSQGVIRTVAGTGGSGISGDNGPATAARIGTPYDVAADDSGSYLIADQTTQRIRRVDAGGTITTIAGNGGHSFLGQSGPARQLGIGRATGIALAGAGNYYVSDGREAVWHIDALGYLTTFAGTHGGPFEIAPAHIDVDEFGSLYVADRLSLRIRRYTSIGTIDTVAGNGEAFFYGEGTPALRSKLRSPRGIAFDRLGNLFIADSQNYRVRKVSPGGVIRTFAGTGSQTASGDGGQATNAGFRSIVDVDIDESGNVYIADQTNGRIRRVGTDGVIRHFAGGGPSSSSGDGGPATSARFLSIDGVEVGPAGQLFICEFATRRVRRVDANGIINTVAGTGSSSYNGDGGSALQANISPKDIAVDRSGNLFIADFQNHRIRRVDPNGIISTVAGNGQSGSSGDGGPAVEASLSSPTKVAVDDFGNVYFYDSSRRVRRVDVAGRITLVAGTGPFGLEGDGGPATEASLRSVNGLAVDAEGDLLISDEDRIRKVTFYEDVTCDAGGPYESECAGALTSLTLDGSASAGPSGTPLTYAWSTDCPGADLEASGSAQAVLRTAYQPPGPVQCEVTLAVAAGANRKTCTADIVVRDTTPPHLSVQVTPRLLWPPNHRMVDMAAQVMATDECVTPTVTLSAVSSSEADNEPGRSDGDTVPDIEAGIGASDLEFALRAERDGAGSGRVYTVEYVASDGSGNEANASAQVFVPHDQGGSVEPVVVSATQQLTGTLLTWIAAPDAQSYDIVRGDLRQLADRGDAVDLGAVACVESRSVDETTAGYADSETPAPGRAFFYLVGYHSEQFSSFGSESTGKPRIVGSGGCTGQAGSRTPAVNPPAVQISRD